MSLKKFLRQARKYWWVPVVLALIGAVAGLGFARFTNRAISPSFEASAVVIFDETDSDRDRSALVDQLADAAELARTANADVIESGRGLVTIDERAAQLQLSARSTTGDEAEETAATMRQAYLQAVTTELVTGTEDRRQAIVVEAIGIISQLNELAPDTPVLEPEPEPEPLDPLVQAQLDLLNSEVASLTQQRSKLAVDLVLAEGGDDERAGTPEEIQDEIDLVTTRLEEVYSEIAVITEENGVTSERTVTVTRTPETTVPREGEIPTVNEPDELESAWMISALEARYDELANEFEGLFVAGRTPDETPPELPPVSVDDLTPQRRSPILFGLIGLLAGLVLGLALGFAWAAIRRRVWSSADLPVALLGEMPSKWKVTHTRQRVATKVSGRRKAAILGLRNLVISALDQSSGAPVVGLVGVEVDPTESWGLASDLAASIGATDRSVLLLDLSFAVVDTPDLDSDVHSEVEAFSSMRINVCDVVGLGQPGSLERDTAVVRLLEEIPFVGGVREVPAGQPVGEAVDLVLTPAFGSFVEVARNTVDVVVAILPRFDDAVLDAIRPRVDHLVAVCALGRTRRRSVNRLSRWWSEGRMAGAVLLTGTRSHLDVLQSRVRSRLKRPKEQDVAPEPVEPDAVDSLVKA